MPSKYIPLVSVLLAETSLRITWLPNRIAPYTALTLSLCHRLSDPLSSLTTPNKRRPPAGEDLLAVARACRGRRSQHHGGVLAVPSPHVRRARDVLARSRLHDELVHAYRPGLLVGIRAGEWSSIRCDTGGCMCILGFI